MVHPTVRAAAEWSWRLLLILAAVYILGRLFEKFNEVTVPLSLAVLFSAFLVPAVDFLNRRRWPRSLAVVVVMLVALGVVAGVLTFVGRAFVSGFPELTNEVVATIKQTQNWLVDGPLKIDRSQVSHLGDNVVTLMQHNQEKLASGALATATTATELVTGLLLMVFLIIFFLYGGGQIWSFCTRLIPRGSRDRVTAAGIAGFGTLVAYVRATVVVALVDAICIGVGLAILRVPLALPLATLIFLFSFIPIVGALISGTVAVMIALVTQGWLTAVIVLAILVGVMQLEGHVLQPFLMGRSVRLHPVAVVLAIAAGIVAAGIVGGLLAVPLIAFCNTAIRYLAGHPVSAILGDGDGFEASPDPPVWDRVRLETAIDDAEELAERLDEPHEPTAADDAPADGAAQQETADDGAPGGTTRRPDATDVPNAGDSASPQD
ncbi:AI-2E family transporter [Gordonia sp. VNQ95]|uniref:AI-2E family transporter n=1 Tax=Gordonia sp. VNQ95 TaxID=3156619 RepID=UPI0032B5F861